ncbi:MAG: DNA-damage-inducible protein D [Microgenomates group bacterium GW2011_GWA2_47_8]|nr:MAG: DNA-damage-inducible protein D [Microgenomates group bacterium GW2011_GWA2_47_8]
MEHKPVIFEQIKHTNEHQSEYWSARQLAKVLEYSEFRHFQPVIEKAKKACKNSGQSVKNHFEDVLDMVEIGSSASREVKDVQLSRYACYLVVQNADPSKEIVALGQTYFAIQTRKQEVREEQIEDQKRLFLRGEVTTHNKHLAETASRAGVKNYAVFTNYGYMGLYGGLKVQAIHKKKRLKKSQKILDHMGSEELAANLFRATQTDAKIKREQIQGEARANKAHFAVGRKVRQTIGELGGTMPERLPTSDGVGKAKTRVKKLAGQKRKELEG